MTSEEDIRARYERFRNRACSAYGRSMGRAKPRTYASLQAELRELDSQMRDEIAALAPAALAPAPTAVAPAPEPVPATAPVAPSVPAAIAKVRRPRKRVLRPRIAIDAETPARVVKHRKPRGPVPAATPVATSPAETPSAATKAVATPPPAVVAPESPAPIVVSATLPAFSAAAVAVEAKLLGDEIIAEYHVKVKGYGGFKLEPAQRALRGKDLLTAVTSVHNLRTGHLNTAQTSAVARVRAWALQHNEPLQAARGQRLRDRDATSNDDVTQILSWVNCIRQHERDLEARINRLHDKYAQTVKTAFAADKAAVERLGSPSATASEAADDEA